MFFFLQKNANNIESERSRRIARQFDDDSEEEYYAVVEYEINNKSEEHLKFLKNILAPLVEAYTITAFCMNKLVGRTLLETEIISEISDEIKQQLRNGSLVCGKN